MSSISDTVSRVVCLFMNEWLEFRFVREITARDGYKGKGYDRDKICERAEL